MRRTAAVLVLSIAAGVATTIRPTLHDFGRWAVGAISPDQAFRVTLPAGAVLTDSIDVSIVGADPADFDLSNATRRGQTQRMECKLGSGLIVPATAGACDIDVQFWPRSIGPKAAKLQVMDKTGTIATALVDNAERGDGMG